MDILNWLYLVKNKFTRTTIENPDTDLVVLGADVGFQKRGDKYQNYVMTAQDFGISAKGYKSTVLVISQKDINAPVIQNVLINEIGGTWTGTYDAVGNYTLNNSDTSLVFLNATTAIFYTDGDNTIPGEVAFYNNGSNIRIATWNSAGVATDEILYGFLEIRQYI
jgi:hypothetical protein